MSREQLARRQHEVLGALLRHEVPEGFDPRAADLTSRVLTTKRRSEVVRAVPALSTVAGFAAAFDSWSAAGARAGCAHDDALDFIVATDLSLTDPFDSIRAVEWVYRGHRRRAHDRRPGERPWVVALAGRVWHVGPRRAQL